MNGWIGFDLDGTLATYEGWVGVLQIGEPIAPVVERAKQYLAQGIEVRIMTARVAGERDRDEVVGAIDAWCLEVFGHTLPVTNVKDFGMVRLYDDRAVAVELNTGRMAYFNEGEVVTP